MAEVDLILVCWNHLDLTRQCIESLRKHTRDIEYRLIVIDNASTDGTPDYLKGLGDVVLIRNEENLGFIKAANQGLRQVKAPYFCLLNNDVEFEEGWLRRLLNILARDEKIGLVGPLSTADAQWQGIGRVSRELGRPLPGPIGSHIENVTMVAFFCALFRSEVLARVGYLDEETFEFSYVEDDDYCIRLHEAGYKVALALDTVIRHHHRVTYHELPEIAERHQRNWEALRAKWGPKGYRFQEHQASAEQPPAGDARPLVWVRHLTQGYCCHEQTYALIQMSHDPRFRLHFKPSNLKPISHNRNSIVQEFLAAPTRPEVLFMFDDDITFSRSPLDAVQIMLDQDLDILGLPCPSWNDAVNVDVPLYWLVMEWVEAEQGYRPISFEGTEGLVECDAVGTGAILVRRRVLEAIKAPFARQWDEDGLQLLGLDFNFCLKARSHRPPFRVHAHWDFKCGHKVEVDLLQVNRVLVFVDQEGYNRALRELRVQGTVTI